MRRRNKMADSAAETASQETAVTNSSSRQLTDPERFPALTAFIAVGVEALVRSRR